MNALAYTVGRDVVFGAGQYASGTSEGRRLVTHQLTVVMQQVSIGSSIAHHISSSSEGDTLETEADQIALRVIRSEPTRIVQQTRVPTIQYQRPRGDSVCREVDRTPYDI